MKILVKSTVSRPSGEVIPIPEDKSFHFMKELPNVQYLINYAESENKSEFSGILLIDAENVETARKTLIAGMLRYMLQDDCTIGITGRSADCMKESVATLKTLKNRLENLIEKNKSATTIELPITKKEYALIAYSVFIPQTDGKNVTHKFIYDVEEYGTYHFHALPEKMDIQVLLDVLGESLTTGGVMWLDPVIYKKNRVYKLSLKLIED